jgi:predicted LPLAT superfamily acyltransferase
VPAPEPQRPAASAPQRWKGRSRGGALLLRTCAALLPLVGARGAWLIAWGISFGFVLTGGRRQYGMIAYWRRLRPRAGIALLHLLAWRHFASFGRILCDRLLVCLRPKDYRIDLVGLHAMREFRRRRQGCIMLSAHVGNWELSSLWLHTIAEDVGKVHVVMVRNDNEEVQRFVDQHMRGDFTAVIDPRDGIGASLAINAALQAGDVVCMLGDRVMGGQPFLVVDFLGGKARFPSGPFHTAMMTGAPILVGFLVKTGLHDYLVEVDAPWFIRMPARRADRPAVLQAAVQRWARRLELQVRRYPQQWHNFYDFWEQ